MRILLTNDDGYSALGLTSLFEILKKFDFEVFVYAPYENQSSCGHGIHLQKGFQVVEQTKSVFSVNGSPADSVRLGLTLMKEQKLLPDLVLSGVNLGSNFAQDIYYSGTVAAAREALFQGVPAVSLSLFEAEKICDPSVLKGNILHFIKLLKSDVFQKNLVPDKLLNINFPNKIASEMSFTCLGSRTYALSSAFKDKKYFLESKLLSYDKSTKTDTGAVFKGVMSLNYMHLMPHSYEILKEEQAKWMKAFDSELVL